MATSYCKLDRVDGYRCMAPRATIAQCRYRDASDPAGWCAWHTVSWEANALAEFWCTNGRAQAEAREKEGE